MPKTLKLQAPKTMEIDKEEGAGKKKQARPLMKSCRGCNLWDEVKERVRITELLEKALRQMEARITEGEFKPTMGDYLKLMQLEKDFEQEEIKEIKVTWVAPESFEPGK
jgi:hypothetical protein